MSGKKWIIFMSKIKNALIDIYGEDWAQRLADIAMTRSIEHGRR